MTPDPTPLALAMEQTSDGPRPIPGAQPVPWLPLKARAAEATYLFPLERQAPYTALYHVMLGGMTRLYAVTGEPDSCQECYTSRPCDHDRALARTRGTDDARTMPKHTPKRPYYSTALRAELDAMRVRWREVKAPNSPKLTLRQLHALVTLERTWVEPEHDGWYPEYEHDMAELQALFDATHPSWTNIRAQIHFAMKSSGPVTVTGPGGVPLAPPRD